MNQDLDALPLPEPLAFIHTGDDYGGERDDPDIEVNSWKALLDFSMTKPCDTSVGLHPDDAIRAARREGYELAMSMQANEQWLVAKQAAIDVGGERPDLGYFVPSDLGPFPSFEECAAAITECGLPLGWVAIRLQQLIPGAFAPALASQPAQEQINAQGKSNAELDIHSNHAQSQQRWNMACAVEMGQPMGSGKDSLSGDIEPQGAQSLERWLCGILKPLAEDIAKNCSTVPQLVIAPLIWGISDLLKSGALCTSQPSKSDDLQQQAGAAEVSDEQIDEVLLFETGFDGFGTQEMNSDDLRRVCRAVLALKTAGGVA